MNFDFEDLKPSNGYDEYKYFDWYNFDEVEKLRAERSKKYMALIRKWHNAKEKDDKVAMKKASKAMSKHRELDESLKAKAENAGHYWY